MTTTIITTDLKSIATTIWNCRGLQIVGADLQIADDDLQIVGDDLQIAVCRAPPRRAIASGLMQGLVNLQIVAYNLQIVIDNLQINLQIDAEW